jgi:hypothetical protein
MKKSLALTAVVLILSVFLLAPISEAATVSNATIVRVSIFSGGSSSFIYFRTGGLDNTYNYCTTADAKLINAATAAMSGPANVQVVTGSACNTATNSSCGSCTTIRINP